MEFLRITAADGTRKYIPDNYVMQISVSAEAKDTGSGYRAPNVVRGKITEVKYYDGANATAGAIVVTAVIPWVTGGIKYEYGCHTFDGAFSVVITN